MVAPFGRLFVFWRNRDDIFGVLPGVWTRGPFTDSSGGKTLSRFYTLAAVLQWCDGCVAGHSGGDSIADSCKNTDTTGTCASVRRGYSVPGEPSAGD